MNLKFPEVPQFIILRIPFFLVVMVVLTKLNSQVTRKGHRLRLNFEARLCAKKGGWGSKEGRRGRRVEKVKKTQSPIKFGDYKSSRYIGCAVRNKQAYKPN